MIPPIIVTLTNRSNAAKYQVEYYNAGRPRCVSVRELSSRTGNLRWRAIWNSDCPLEGQALAAINEASRLRGISR
jgi:hypothetical protein